MGSCLYGFDATRMGPMYVCAHGRTRHEHQRQRRAVAPHTKNGTARGTAGNGVAHVDLVLPVALAQVVQDGGLVQVRQVHLSGHVSGALRSTCHAARCGARTMFSTEAKEVSVRGITSAAQSRPAYSCAPPRPVNHPVTHHPSRPGCF